jgi:hypothetical protein
MSAITIHEAQPYRHPQKRIEAGGRHKAPTRLTRFLGRISSSFKTVSPEGESTQAATTEKTQILSEDSQKIAAEMAQIKPTPVAEILRRGNAMHKLREERLPLTEQPTPKSEQAAAAENEPEDIVMRTSSGLPMRGGAARTTVGQDKPNEAIEGRADVPTHRAEYSDDESSRAGRHRAIVHRLGLHALDIPPVDANQVHEAALPAELYEPKHRG